MQVFLFLLNCLKKESLLYIKNDLQDQEITALRLLLMQRENISYQIIKAQGLL